MKTCEYAGLPLSAARSHPWVDAAGRPEHRYYDLKAAPERIRTDLEDLRPWSRYAAIEEFYLLLERVNGPASTLESNDCEFSGPHETDAPGVPQRLQVSGRVMVLFRQLRRNTRSGEIERLKNQLHRDLAARDPGLELGVVGTTIVPVLYRAVGPAHEGTPGTQLLISLWAWGDTDEEAMGNLGRVLTNLSVSLRRAEA